MDRENNRLSKIAIAVAILATVILGFDKIKVIIDIIINALAPFLIGGFVAMFINIPVRFFESKVFRFKYKKMNRVLSIFLAMVLIVGIVTGIIGLVIPQVSETLVEITRTIPDSVKQGIEYAEENFEFNKEFSEILIEVKAASGSWQGLVTYFSQFITIEDSGDAVISVYTIIKSVFGSITNVFIAMFFAMYSLMEKENMSNFAKKTVKAFCGNNTAEKTIHISKLFHKNFEDFFYGQFLECFVVACIFTIIISLFGFKCSIIVGIITLFLAFIPYVGNFLSCGIGMLLTLAMEGPIRMIIFAVIFAVVQMIDGYFIYPKIMSLKVKMPSLAIFVVVLIGGNLFGFVGMILVIPFATTIYMLIQEKIANSEKINKISSAEKQMNNKKKV